MPAAMNGRRSAVVLVVALLSLGGLPSWMASATDFRPSGATLGQLPIPEPLRLRFNGFDFDPLAGEPSIPSDMVAGPENDLFLLQFRGPVTTGAKEQIRLHGVRYGWYIPEYAFVIRADPSVAASLRQLDAVRWVGPYHPAYRLQQDLLWGTPAGGELEVFIVPFDAPAPGHAASLLAAAGGRVRFDDSAYAHGWIDASQLRPLARHPDLVWVQPIGPYELRNNDYAKLIDIRQETDGAFSNPGDALWSWNAARSNFEGTNGSGIVIAVGDTGIDGTHEMFPAWKKKAYYAYGATDWDDCFGHGTHVAGTTGGFDGPNAGMAPGVRIVGQDAGFCGPGPAMDIMFRDAEAEGAQIHTDSWGPSGSYGDYEAFTAAWDGYVRDANTTIAGKQQVLTTVAAGNSGPGSPSVEPPGAAKNILSIGSGTATLAGVSDFSARGPTDDGRIKPDLISPGEDVFSASTSCSTCYTTLAGTSMATPGVAGSAAVVMQHYRDAEGVLPSAPLTKAMLINGARPIGALTWPGNEQGWGRIDVARSLLETGTRKIWTYDGNESTGLVTGEDSNWMMTLGTASELRVTLVWTDVPGAGNNPNPALVNDLDLKVTDPAGTVYRGNVFTAAYSTSGGSADRKNNVEQVRIAVPGQGDWAVNVAANNVPTGTQEFALVVSGDVRKIGSRFELEASNLTALPAAPVEGDRVVLTGIVANFGVQPVAAVPWQIWQDDAALGSILLSSGTLSDLGPNQTAIVLAAWTATKGLGHTFRLEVDPANLIPESQESDNRLLLTLDVHFHAFSLFTPGASVRPATPGIPLAIPVRVENQGDLLDHYEVTAEGPDGWGTKPAVTHFDVTGGASGNVTVTVVPTLTSIAASRHEVSFRARSSATSLVVTRTVTVQVTQVFSFEALAAVRDARTPPEAPVAYTVEVRNTGNGHDVLALEVSAAPKGWLVQLSTDALPLDAFSSAPAFLEVTPPLATSAGDTGAVELRVTSAGAPKLPASVLRFVTTVDRVVRLDAAFTQIDAEVLPGATASFGAELRNRGNAGEQVRLTVRVPDGWAPATLDAPAAELAPGTSITVSVFVTPPDDARAGEYPVTLQATLGDPGTAEAKSQTFLLGVKSLPSVRLSAAPQRSVLAPGGGTVVEVYVTNDGNGATIYRIDAAATPGALELGWNSTTVELLPDERRLLFFPVAAGGAEAGIHTIGFQAVAVDRPDVTARAGAAIEVRPIPPDPETNTTGLEPTPEDDRFVERVTTGASPGIGTLLALLLAIASVVGLFLLVRTRRRPPTLPTEVPSDPSGGPEPTRPAGTESPLVGEGPSLETTTEPAAQIATDRPGTEDPENPGPPAS